MNADGFLSDYSSGDDPEHDSCDVSSPETQVAARAPPRSQRRPARQILPFVPYEDWDPDQSYDEQPPTCMHYTMEWKLTLNRRAAAKQTEDDLVLAPSSFWRERLLSKISDIAKSTGKPYEAEATTIIMSVNERSERDITKRFEKLQIDWPVVERQLQAWSHLLRIGKKLRISVVLNYMESRPARTAGRGATATQLAELNDQLDAEEAVLDRPAAWVRVSRIFRCEGPPRCDLGQHCWIDEADGKKHYPILTHQLRALVKRAQQGYRLEDHDDVPQEIRAELYAEAQQRLDRKRKRQDSGSPTSGPIIVNNYIPPYPSPAVNASSPTMPYTVSASDPPAFSLTIPGLRDDAVEAYYEWHCSKVRSRDQKRQYELARNLTLERCFDLELLHEDNDPQYFIERGVTEGIARRWVRDVKLFLDQYSLQMP